LPYYAFSPTKNHPLTRPTVSKHPEVLFLALLTLIYLSPHSPALSSQPTLPSGTLGKPTTLPAHEQIIISNPNEPRHHGNMGFFGWSGSAHMHL